jgi:hypothetical protein
MALLDRNLPTLRGWDVLNRLEAGDDNGPRLTAVVGRIRVSESITDGQITFHGASCSTLPDAHAVRLLDVQSAIYMPWCEHCASDPAAHVENWHLNCYAQAEQILADGEPIARRDVAHTALCIGTINDDATWNAHVRPFAAQLNTLFDTGTAREALLDVAVIAVACTHLDVADTSENRSRTIPRSWTDGTVVQRSFIADCFQQTDGDIHATIDLISDTLDASRRTEAHQAADNADLTPRLIVTFDEATRWFARQQPLWTTDRQFTHTDGPTTALLGPAVLAATSWTAKTTRIVDIDAASVTRELLGTLCVCITAAVGDGGDLDDVDVPIVGDHITTAIEAAIALHN